MTAMTEAGARRSRSNKNDRGSTRDRARRRAWLMETYRSDVDLAPGTSVETGAFLEPGHGVPTVRCYRCGDLMTESDLTIDRIIPGIRGGTYRRNNIRPACGPCNFGFNRHVGRWAQEETSNA